MKLYFPSSLLQLVADTPLINLKWIGAKNGTRFFSKCEFVGPSGSHKDRMYQYMIDHLERAGIIHPVQRLVDFSSGNAGAALSFVGAAKGYRVTIVRPSGLSRTKADQIKALGAELIITPREEGVAGAQRVAVELVKNSSSEAYLMHQTDSVLNVEAFAECGGEIVQKFKQNDLNIDAFVCGIGTGGTLSGVAQVIKGAYPDAIVVGGEVEGAEVNLAKLKHKDIEVHPHHLEGLSPGMAFGNTHLDLIDQLEICSEAEAWETVFDLEKHGFLVGPSSGFNVAIAKRVAERLPEGANLVTIFFDAGWKYYPERESWLSALRQKSK
jgi:cysteine synthase A